MPLEFALRPRIKLAEGFAPPRRSRFRLPKLVLPVAAYWLLAGGITYGLIRAHAQPDALASAPSLAAPSLPVPPRAKPAEESWQPVSARSAAPSPESEPAVAPAVEHAPALAPSVQQAPRAAEPAPSEPTLARDDADGPAIAARRQPRTKPSSDSAATDDSQEIHDAPAALLGAAPPDAPAAVAKALPSCEAAAAAATQEVDFAHRDSSADLSREVIASVLDNGVWIARCDIPMSSSIELCVAIKGGVVIGASVDSKPASAAIDACVKRRAAGLHFPFSSRVDLARTHF